MKLKRDFLGPVELRAGKGELPDIVGLAAPFYREGDGGTEYMLWSGAVERYMPTAFDSMLADGDDVFASFNHNADNVLARRGSGTLSLSKTDRGLEYVIQANDDSPFYREMISRIERGDVPGSSITFSVRENGVEWVKSERDGEPDVRELHGVHVYELGPVVSPAYRATETGLRDDRQLQEARQSWEQWKDSSKPAKPIRREMARLYLDTVRDVTAD